MGYRPSQVARSLVTGRTRTLGVVITDVTDPFVAEVMKRRGAGQSGDGLHALFASSDHDPDREIEALHLLLDRQVDGMIVISGRAGSRYAELRSPGEAGIADWPLVLVNNEQSGPGIHSVRMDNAAGAHEAVSYLRRLGHQRTRSFRGRKGAAAAPNAPAGYRHGIAANGLGPLGEIVVAGAGLLEDGPRALEAMVGRTDPPTAVLCYNDLAAIGLLAAAARTGIRVPDDLAVIGYDNLPLSAFCVPALTTVDQPKEQMGRAAVTMCLQALAVEQVCNVVLKGRLILRDSTGERP